jgi:hypothetical protein
MRRFLVISSLLLTALTLLSGCRPPAPEPGDYAEREPLEPFYVHMRATGGYDLSEMRYAEWTIEYEGGDKLHYEYLAESDMGHIDHNEAELPAWRGYELWDAFEEAGIWELYTDSSVEMRNKATYEVEVRRGGQRNDFSIYAPGYHSKDGYEIVVNAIEGFF